MVVVVDVGADVVVSDCVVVVALHPDHRLFHSVTPDHPQTYTLAGNTGPNQRARQHPLDTKRLRSGTLGERCVMAQIQFSALVVLSGMGAARYDLAVPGVPRLGRALGVSHRSGRSLGPRRQQELDRFGRQLKETLG